MISCPGKVLITGAYLILESSYRGLVLSLDSRIGVTIECRDLEKEENQQNSNTESCKISVDSPILNFLQNYEYDLSSRKLVVPSNAVPNSFVEKTLEYTIGIVAELYGITSLKNQMINIKITTDKAFYFSTSKEEKITKTGLGSSAAMTTALCGALLWKFSNLHKPKTSNQEDLQEKEKNTEKNTEKEKEKIVELESREIENVFMKFGEKKQRYQDIVFRLSLFAHCLAQGKIGSGFDISSAVYGSHCFQRKTQTILEKLLDLYQSSEETEKSKKHFYKEILNQLLFNPCLAENTKSMKSSQNLEDTHFDMPNELELIMANDGMFTKTTGMVRSVLKWKKTDPVSSLKLWNQLGELNEEFFLKMKNFQISGLSEIKSLFSKIRKLLKQMGENSKAEIEPDSRTIFLDKLNKMPQIVAAGVSGAGGYDSIFLIYMKSEKNTKAINQVLQDNEFKLLPVNYENRGILLHPLKK
ncbi:phosphomevalonate kinase [Anaeramoeba flamelloides]|uniref:phosphomevalonate kinase n=1 Tax=Anaeramoeba flamelloides TaxID=1746091 RepID=A0ABQ8Z2P4_9EUKA|nr:phosphomevalonate kinase [Anaeramoeba flamelloides]